MFLKATTLPTGYLGSGVYLSLLSLYLHGWMIREETETGRRWTHFYSLPLVQINQSHFTHHIGAETNPPPTFPSPSLFSPSGFCRGYLSVPEFRIHAQLWDLSEILSLYLGIWQCRTFWTV